MMTKAVDSLERECWDLLEKVSDPEIPVLSVVDLGIVRSVEIKEDGQPKVVITPTYSGCPATKVIEEDIRTMLIDNGFSSPELITSIHPAWTTDWLSEAGKKKLKEYGIAPPVKGSEDKNALFAAPRQIKCPRCNSENTEMKSQFGSTPCKALYVCKNCLEPFDYFKCL